MQQVPLQMPLLKQDHLKFNWEKAISGFYNLPTSNRFSQSGRYFACISTKSLDYSTYLKNMNTLEASMKIFWISWKSKYAHLKDYDTITDPKAPPKRKADNSAYNLFNQKFEELSKASNSGIWGGQIFAQAKVFKAPALPRRTDQLAAQQEVEDNKSFDQD
ncbi:hypothetical protein Pst134EA_029221 [Puccinia striiformis f. sp. tritici]|uniref:hypothetical protein n=1 Tax=Puccinia striiformis f. sp. tritici TaxID=168172 RepID=UPI002007FFD9|nr:hypothetical protein Pst134EA_029221 [Puccinia striiformis f. sp. tritici]KAH9447180.1 hypothetical protein Pst134EA_029221 [Puccinia striiformis f. sp. tritici]